MRVRGDVPALVVLIVLGGASFGGVGLLVASRAKTMETVSGLMNLVMLPMYVLSGVFFSSERFPEVVQPFIQALPLTALNDGLRAVMNDGAGWRRWPAAAGAGGLGRGELRAGAAVVPLAVAGRRLVLSTGGVGYGARSRAYPSAATDPGRTVSCWVGSVPLCGWAAELDVQPRRVGNQEVSMNYFLAVALVWLPAAAGSASDMEPPPREQPKIDVTGAGETAMELAKTTKDPDAKWMSIRILGNLRYERAVPLLLESLSDPHHYCCANAARALGDMKVAAAAKPLTELLRKEKDGGVIQQTSLALANLGYADALPALTGVADTRTCRRACGSSRRSGASAASGTCRSWPGTWMTRRNPCR